MTPIHPQWEMGDPLRHRAGTGGDGEKLRNRQRDRAVETESYVGAEGQRRDGERNADQGKRKEHGV